jgi:putative methyltransferase
MNNMSKTIVVYNPVRFTGEAWLPILWAQAKTYYERHGHKKNNWTWAPCYADLHGNDLERTKQIINDIKPDVFAVSFYVWNYQPAHAIAKWVKQQWPDCLIITGGPHQYFKYDDDWFVKHPYIDASLPGDSFGEICLQELLDNINNDGSIDWNQVSNICYPHGQSRLKCYSKKVYGVKEKITFDYNWSTFDSQLTEIKDFINYAKINFDTPKILSIFETTRGCPYGCTYCDWGGGINTKVVKRDIEYVKQDIDALCTLNLTYLYFADANFGIFGDRDVKIIEHLAKTKKLNQQNFAVGYGGFAKTENRLSYIREILKIDILNNLSVLGEIKISMQSLHEDVLKKIDRKNIDLDKQILTLQSLAPFKRLPIYVELIYGLPGMTLKNFYQELNILGDKDLSVQWYPWILLPEAPAYSREYRKENKLNTIIKTSEWWWADNESKNNHNEIVVGSLSYSTDDYLEMLLASSLYRLFVQGGYYKKSINYIKKRQIRVGSIIQCLINEFLYSTPVYQAVLKHWREQILIDPTKGCVIKVADHDVYLGLYFIAIAFINHENFTLPIGDWLHKKYQVPHRLIHKDQSLTVHSKNFGTTTNQNIFQINFQTMEYKTESMLTNILLQFTQFKNSGNILQAQRKVFGMIDYS